MLQSCFAGFTFGPVSAAFNAARRHVAETLCCALALASAASAQTPAEAQRARARQFAQQHATPDTAAALRARSQAAALLFRPRNATFTAAWQPLGPSGITSPTYGTLTGRITSIAADPNDPTGNTLYVGTTGGGVWKSTNAVGAATFVPLTDTLPVFAAGGSAVPSLSIGAVAVQPIANPVLLAGTGDPNDATDSYYGEGLLRSTDGGVTWTLVQGTHATTTANYSFAGLSTAGLAFSTATPALVVAAMSQSADGLITGSANTSVPGLYYSTDAGQTWQMATVYDGAAIVQQPLALGATVTGNAATSVVWDAFRGAFFAVLQNHGYYSSTDGATWHRLAAQPGANITLANCPTLALTSGSCPVFRGTLAVQPATGDLYALTVDANNNDQGLWQDLCAATNGACASSAPAFATRIDGGALEAGSGSTAIPQGSYNLALSAAPTASGGTLLLAGTVDVYRCALAYGATSCTWRNTTNALNGCNAPAMVAPSQHALTAVPQATGAPLIYLGNDGGLWRSSDGIAETGAVCSATDASHFTNLNGGLGSLAEVTGFAQDPANPAILLAGLGANGSAATATASSTGPWPQMSIGEGGYPLLDPATPSNWFLAIGAGVNVAACPLGAACTPANFAAPATIGGAQVAYDAALLDAPTLLDPGMTTQLLAGTCRIWRGPATSGSAWTASNAISPSFGGGALPCTSSSALVRSVAAGGPSVNASSAQNAGSTVLYAGMAGALDGGSTIAGHVFVTKSANTANATTPWTDITASPVTNDATAFNAGRFDVSSLTVDAHDASGATVYATIMGFGVAHVYRSTDFGAHWLNLTANLPDAPANALAVDPDSAATVYVATDAGVYATTSIATCATQNCWNALGTGLPNAPVTALAAAAQMPTGDGRLGMLRAATYGRGLWQQPLLNAVSIAQPAITESATTFNFAAQAVGTQSSAQTLTLTSSGNAPATISSVAITGDFTETDNCAGQTLAVGATCTIYIAFAPSATGTRSGTLTVYANVASGQGLVVSLTGLGTAPAAVVLTPSALTFAATIVNQTSAAQTISIANTGGTTATLTSITTSGDFAISANTCGATLPAQTACAVSITFTPTASGARTGALTVVDSAGTQVAPLTGIGQAPATDTLSPASLTFAQQQVGTASAAQTVTLTNSGDVALTGLSASASSQDFTVVNGCGTSLAGHTTCSISVAFAPTATGTRSATLTVTDALRSQTVALVGTGVAPPGVSLSPATLTFGQTGVGLATTPQTVTLTNNGGLTLNITATKLSAGFTMANSTCGATLAAGTACTMQMLFDPATAGLVNGALTLTDNASGGTQTVALTGVGVDFALQATGATSATMTGAGTVTFPLQVSSVAGLSGAVAMSCTSIPAHATCVVAPTAPALGATTSLTVTVSTGAVAMLQRAPSPVVWCLLLLPVCLYRRSRRLARLLALAALTGCGAGRLLPSGSGTGIPATPSGTYNLTVSGTSAGLTHSVNLTVTVQ